MLWIIGAALLGLGIVWAFNGDARRRRALKRMGIDERDRSTWPNVD